MPITTTKQRTTTTKVSTTFIHKDIQEMLIHKLTSQSGFAYNNISTRLGYTVDYDDMDEVEIQVSLSNTCEETL